MATPIEYGIVLSAVAVVGITVTALVGVQLSELASASASAEVRGFLSGELLDAETGIGTVPAVRTAALSRFSGCGHDAPAFGDRAASPPREGTWERVTEMSREGCQGSQAFSYSLRKDPDGRWKLDGEITPVAAEAAKPR